MQHHDQAGIGRPFATKKKLICMRCFEGSTGTVPRPDPAFPVATAGQCCRGKVFVRKVSRGMYVYGWECVVSVATYGQNGVFLVLKSPKAAISEFSVPDF